MKMGNAPLRILLADDDEGDRLLFKEILDEIETSTIVHTVNDGVQLMEYLLEEGVRLPDLLFLDLNMPFKNGMECLKEIRSNEAFNDISIAIYSTSSTENDIDEAFRLGANIYITKPASFQSLKQVLTKAVTIVRQNQDATFNRDNFVLRI